VLIFGGSSGMGKATGVAVLREGGTPFLIGRSVPKLEAAQAVVSPADPSLVKIASVDCLNDDAVEAFFHDQALGSYHHIVCTLGESTEYAKCPSRVAHISYLPWLCNMHPSVYFMDSRRRCKSIVGKAGLAGLKAQMNAKFFAQLAPVSLGVEKMAEGGSVVLTGKAYCLVTFDFNYLKSEICTPRYSLQSCRLLFCCLSICSSCVCACVCFIEIILHPMTGGALAIRPGKGNAALAVANAALDSIVKGLANDFGPKHRINCMKPLRWFCL
jgi:NAD(P)-dependent dehydrogenase (short-subunit alcohol dehydrogenase family)